MSKKRKTPRQQPPSQSQTQRPSPTLLKAKTKAKRPRKGFLNLTPLEAEIFLEMKEENQRLKIQEAQVQAQWRALLERHNKIVVALGKTHRLDFRFRVTVNENGTGLNYTEVREEEDANNPADEGTEGTS